MKKLFLKIILLVLLVAGIISIMLLFTVPINDASYEAATRDKHMLLRSVLPPRIIFVGGSNLAFGLDSKLIGKAVGTRVINMGLNSGLGLKFHLAEVVPQVRKGDIIVIVPEYENFFGNYFYGDVDLAIHFLKFPETREYVTSAKQYFSILKNYQTMLRVSIFNTSSGAEISQRPVFYCRKAFNENGDFVGHLDKKSVDFKKSGFSEMNGEVNCGVISELNDYKSYIEKKGAKVFFIFPCFMDKAYEKNMKKISLLYASMKEKLKITMLSTPSDCVLPEACFFDTFYHLTREGRQIMTQKIIADLRGVADEL